MKLGRRSIGVIVTLVVLGIAGWAFWQRYWIYIPGWISRVRDPIGPNHEVTWNAGPQTAAAPTSERPPNVVFILADDLGYNDLTFGGGGVAGGAVATPHIDSIARDGVTFTNGYAGNATCAPSRAAIMTGRYATRFGFEFTPAPMQFAKLLASRLPGSIYHAEREADVPSVDAMSVPADEVMMPQLLKTRDYRTIFLGKWHLGELPTTRPEARGFDDVLGFLPGASLYLPKDDPQVVDSVQDFDPIDTFLWANLPFAVTNNRSPRFAPSEYMTDYLGKEAVKAIEANRNRPFFMYLAFNAPHTPLQALKSDYDALPGIRDHRLRVYGAMVRALDRNVGRVLEALKANGLEESTLVIFTSDNGGANYIGLPDVNRPYRGWKATFFEGGIHVPFFIRWPAVLPAGTTYAAPVGHVDIFATAAAAAGAPLPSGRVYDGIDLVPFVLGKRNGTPHESLFWRSGSYRTLLTDGWKLQVEDMPAKTWLFHLDDDPTEKDNLATTRHEKVLELSAQLAAEEAQQHKPLWPSLLEGRISIDHPLNVPDAPGDEYIYWAN